MAKNEVDCLTTVRHFGNLKEKSVCNTILRDKFEFQIIDGEKVKAIILTEVPAIRLDEFDIEGLMESCFRALNQF